MVLYALQLGALKERVGQELHQEVRELERLGRGGDGVPPYTDPQQLITDFIRQSFPGPTRRCWA